MNAYLEFMTSNMAESGMFTQWLKLHKEFVSENPWSESDQMAALYALSKQAVIWRQSSKRNRIALKKAVGPR